MKNIITNVLNAKVAFMTSLTLLSAEVFASTGSDLSAISVKDIAKNTDGLTSTLYWAAGGIFALIGFFIFAKGFMMLKASKQSQEGKGEAIGTMAIGAGLFSLILLIGALNTTLFGDKSTADRYEDRLSVETGK
jgi:uncharacterized membrane protein